MKNTILGAGGLIFVVLMGGYLWSNSSGQIRKQCQKEALEKAVNISNQPSTYISDVNQREIFQNQLKNEYYLSCVREKGLGQ